MQELYERTLLKGALLASRNSGGAIGYGRVKGENQGDSAMTGELRCPEIDRFTDFHLLSQEMIELIVARCENLPLIFNLSSMKPIG
jgi:chemosensory pili system protein ChpA (sensor histidine kinase/response regulator)